MHQSTKWTKLSRHNAKQVYRRRYESRHSSKPKLHFLKNMAKNHFQYGTWNSYTLHSCNVALESWQRIHQVTAPCNVISGSRMTCYWIRLNMCHIGILHLVSISTISLQSTYHSAPVCEILSKSDHPRQKKMTSCQFSRWRMSASLDFMGPIMGSFKSHVWLPIGRQ